MLGVFSQMAEEDKTDDADTAEPRSLLLASIHTSTQLNKLIHRSLTQCAQEKATTSSSSSQQQQEEEGAVGGPELLTSGQLLTHTHKLEQKLEQLMVSYS